MVGEEHGNGKESDDWRTNAWNRRQDCGRVEKRPTDCLGPDVKTLSTNVRRVDLYKGPGKDIGSFGAKGGCERP